MDAVFLARLQFGLTIAFHYIFPPLSIGLGLILVIMESMWLRTRKPLYREMTKFWVKIFALIFSIGVATGIVMEFQFGTNWANYSRYVGDVFGAALAAEGVFAFFLESGFLALLIFGWDRVGPKMHFFATLMVALGSMFSAVWIVVANSWMQTPWGANLPDPAVGRATMIDFWSVVFNPSTVDRLWHVVMGAWQAAAWLVLSVSAFYLLKKRHVEFAKASVRVALIVAVAASVLQLVSGHESGKVVATWQPAKMAAFEGHWETGPAGLYLFGWVDEANQQTSGVQIPGMLSYVAKGDSGATMQGLNDPEFKDALPPVNTVFQTYHAMVGIGFTLIGLSLAGTFYWWRGRLWETRWLLWLFVWAVVLPQAANQLGWFSAEVGRQPWIVYGKMRTADAVSPLVKAPMVLTSVIVFTLIYLLLFVLFFYLLDHKIRTGPEDHIPGEETLPLLHGDRANV